MPLGIRAATPEDASALAELARAAYSVYLPRLPVGVRPAPLDADYAATVHRDEVWVVDRGRRISGFVVLVRQPDHLLLENIAVHPDFQGQGIGGALLSLAEEQAVSRGIPSIRLYTHAVMVENQRLYEHLGYVVTARTTEGGFDRVFYEKQIRAITP